MQKIRETLCKNISGSVKYEGGGINAWGCINIKGVGELFLLENNLNVEFFVTHILAKQLKQSLKSLGLEVNDAMIVEYLDPKQSLCCNYSERETQKQGYHTVYDYFPLGETQALQKMYGNSQKLQFHKENIIISNQQLITFANEELEKFNKDMLPIIQRIVNFYPTRCEHVIKKSGWQKTD